MYKILDMELFDKLNPIEKLDVISRDNEIKDILYINDNDEINLSDTILIALFCIDMVFKEIDGIDYSYHINDDKSVKRLIELSYNVVIDDETFYRNLIALDEAKLIYRFTCAKKFLEADSTVKQLRINSWGNQYIRETNLLVIKNKLVESIYKTFKKIFINNRKDYLALLKLLLLNKDENVVGKIQSINDKLEVKILS